MTSSHLGQRQLYGGVLAERADSWLVEPGSVVAGGLRILVISGFHPGSEVTNDLPKLHDLSPTPDTRIRQNRKSPGTFQARSPYLSQDGIKLVTPVPFDIQRQVQRREQFIFKLPRTLTHNPTDIGVLCHPGRHHLLILDERRTLSPRAHPPQLNPDFISKKATQRPAQCRASRVACEMLRLDPLLEISLTRRSPTVRFLRADSCIQEHQALMLTATRSLHKRRQAPKPPSIHTIPCGNRRRAGEDILAGEHPHGIDERGDLVGNHSIRLEEVVRA